MKKNYLEFGIFSAGKKKRYEIKKGNLYDWYMLPGSSEEYGDLRKQKILINYLSFCITRKI